MAAKWAYLVLMLALLAVPAFAYTVVYQGQTALIMQGANNVANITLLNSMVNNGTANVLTDCDVLDCSVRLSVVAASSGTFNGANLPRALVGHGSATPTGVYVNGAPLGGSISFVKGVPLNVTMNYHKANLNSSVDLLPSAFGLNLTAWAWWNASWAYAVPCVINTTVSSDLVNFPARCDFTGAAVGTGNTTLWNSTTCTNVRFLDSANATVLFYDLDSSNAAFCGNNSANTTFWVTGNYSANVSNTIYAYLGNTGAASGENESQTWKASNNYLQVYHFSADGTDSVTGTILCANTSTVNATAGYIGGARTSGTCTVGFVPSVSPFGYRVWFSTTNNATRASPGGSYTAAYKGGLGVDMTPVTNGINNMHWNGATAVSVLIYQGITHGTWYSGAVMRRTSTDFVGYVNSKSNATATNTGTTAPTRKMCVGAVSYSADCSLAPWSGSLDEFRIYNSTAVTNDWMVAEYAQTAVVGDVAALPAPTMVSSSVLPASAYANSTLLGYCNATDANVATVRYYYQWFVNGTANASGVTGYLAQGVEQNVANITTGLVKGQNWTLQCIANNGVANSSALNSSVRAILNTPPDTGVPTLSPIPAFISTATVTCTNGTTGDIDGDAITFIYLWYLNGTTTGITTQGITNASFGGTDVLICQIKANDGTADSIAYNSSALTILGGAPSLSMAAAPGIIYTANCINATAVFYYTLNDLAGIWGNNTITLVQGGTLAAGVQNNVTANVQHNFTLVLTQGNYTYGMNFTATNGSVVTGVSSPVNMSFTVADSAAACMAWLINGSGTNVSVNLSEIMENATFRRAIAQDVWRYEGRYKAAYSGSDANGALRLQDILVYTAAGLVVIYVAGSWLYGLGKIGKVH